MPQRIVQTQHPEVAAFVLKKMEAAYCSHLREEGQLKVRGTIYNLRGTN